MDNAWARLARTSLRLWSYADQVWKHYSGTILLNTRLPNSRENDKKMHMFLNFDVFVFRQQKELLNIAILKSFSLTVMYRLTCRSAWPTLTTFSLEKTLTRAIMCWQLSISWLTYSIAISLSRTWPLLLSWYGCNSHWCYLIVVLFNFHIFWYHEMWNYIVGTFCSIHSSY